MSQRGRNRKLAKKNRRESRLTRFHIIPKARGGTDKAINVSLVPDYQHRLYHKLFGLKTPDEVIIDLFLNYWNGDFNWIREAHNEVQALYSQN